MSRGLASKAIARAAAAHPAVRRLKRGSPRQKGTASDVAVVAPVVLLLVATLACSASATPVIAIVSPPPGSPASNGDSDNAAFSKDDRNARLLAFDSAATNLVAGDTNGRRDVFVLVRSPEAGSVAGQISRVSVGSHGLQANGDSTEPSVDGTTGSEPHCVAFQSTATNLDRRDRSTDSDVYVRDLRRRTTTLVSVGAGGAINASIDGRCRYVAFESHGLVLERDLANGRTLRVANGTNPDQQTDGKGVVYQRAGQVYYQALGMKRGRLARRGQEVLVSHTASGAPGNGVSGDPSVDDHGRHVAFDSTATDLCTGGACDLPYHPPPDWRKLDPADTQGGRDANGPASDIFRADLTIAAGKPDSMLLASYDAGYNQLEGPSTHPQISRAGHEIAFQSGPTTSPGLTTASASSNIFTWSDAGHPTADGHLHVWSGQWSCQVGVGCPIIPFNGPSYNPSISSRANYIAFTSTEAGLAGERNGASIPDVFLGFTAGAPHLLGRR